MKIRMASFGKIVFKRRVHFGYSHKALAGKLKISSAMICDYELGKSYPNFKKAIMIAKELQFDLDKTLKRRYKRGAIYDKGFAANLSRKREDKGISQEYLAKKLKIGRSMLSKYENSRFVPNLTTVIRMAEFFKCSLYDFV